MVDLVKADVAGPGPAPRAGRTGSAWTSTWVRCPRSRTRIDRAESWIGKPVKPGDTSRLQLGAAQANPAEYIRTMYDLIVLALQTDATRVATYMVAREDGMGLADQFPMLALGLKSGHHAPVARSQRGLLRALGPLRPVPGAAVRLFPGAHGADPRRARNAAGEHAGAVRLRLQHHPRCPQLPADPRRRPAHGPPARPVPPVQRRRCRWRTCSCRCCARSTCRTPSFADSTGPLDQNLLVLNRPRWRRRWQRIRVGGRIGAGAGWSWGDPRGRRGGCRGGSHLHHQLRRGHRG